jgi:hypothetical protein
MLPFSGLSQLTRLVTSSLFYRLLMLLQQPIDTLTHPKFKEMMDIPARATEGVTGWDSSIALGHDERT